MTIGSRIGVGKRTKRVTLQNAGPSVPDGEGGHTNSWLDLSPSSVMAYIRPATEGDLERVAAGTVITTATQLVEMPYHRQVSTDTRVLLDGRVLQVTKVQNVDEANVDLVLVCEEMR